MNNEQYYLKEILAESELELFLKLRYSGFSNSNARSLIMQNEQGVDIDYYDRSALHYGIYKCHSYKAKPVGYFRIVLEESTVADEWVKNIAVRNGLRSMIEKKPSSTFPCLGIYPNTNLVQEFYAKEIQPQKAGEISRFFIVESERSVRLSLEIIRSCFAIALLHIQHAFVGCFNHHAKAYLKFGFQQCPGSSVFILKSSGQQKEGIILYCSADNVSGTLLTKLKMMQWYFLLNNRLTF